MPTSARRPAARTNIKLAFTLGTLIAGTLLYLILRPALRWPGYLVWLLAMSAVTLLLYGFDKLQSPQRGAGVMRVPEVTLHVAAIAGGFPGAWAGMLLLRHKTRHQLFWLIVTASTVAHAILAFFLLR